MRNIDGKKVWFIDKAEDVSPQLTLKGIDISKSVINREKTEEEIKADKKTSAETANIIVIILFFAGAATFMIYRKKKSSALPAYGTEAKSASKKEEIPTVKFADIEGVEGLKNANFAKKLFNFAVGIAVKDVFIIYASSAMKRRMIALSVNYL